MNVAWNETASSCQILGGAVLIGQHWTHWFSKNLLSVLWNQTVQFFILLYYISSRVGMGSFLTGGHCSPHHFGTMWLLFMPFTSYCFFVILSSFYYQALHSCYKCLFILSGIHLLSIICLDSSCELHGTFAYFCVPTHGAEALDRQKVG